MDDVGGGAPDGAPHGAVDGVEYDAEDLDHW